MISQEEYDAILGDAKAYVEQLMRGYGDASKHFALYEKEKMAGDAGLDAYTQKDFREFLPWLAVELEASKVETSEEHTKLDGSQVFTCPTPSDLTAAYFINTYGLDGMVEDAVYLVSLTQEAYRYDSSTGKFEYINLQDNTIYFTGTRTELDTFLEQYTDGLRRPLVWTEDNTTRSQAGKIVVSKHIRVYTFSVRVEQTNRAKGIYQILSNEDGYEIRDYNVTTRNAWSAWRKPGVDAADISCVHLQMRKVGTSIYFMHENLGALANYKPRIVLMRYQPRTKKKGETKKPKKGWVQAVAHLGTNRDNYDSGKELYYLNGTKKVYMTDPNGMWYPIEGLNFTQIKTVLNNYRKTGKEGGVGSETTYAYIKTSGGRARKKHAWFGYAIRINNPAFVANASSDGQTDNYGNKRFLFSQVCKLHVDAGQVEIEDGEVVDSKPLSFGILN